MADDIVLDAGDTRYESITVTDGATPPNPIDFTDATNVVWTATLNGNVVLRKHTADNGIQIVDLTGGTAQNLVPQLLLTLNPDDTSPAFGIGSTTTVNELRIYFTEGGVKSQSLVIKGVSLIVNRAHHAGLKRPFILTQSCRGSFNGKRFQLPAGGKLYALRRDH